MKHVFLLLLAVNIGLFIWGYQREQAVEHKRSYVHDVGELRLLSERKTALAAELTQDLKPMQGPTDIAGEKAQELEKLMVVAASESKAQADASEQLDKKLKLEPQSEKDEQEGDQTTQQEEDDLEAKYEQTAAALDSDTPASDLTDIASKQQAELGPIVKIGQELQTEVTEMIVEPEILSSKLVCYRLGPVLEIASAKGLSERLKQLGFDTVMRKQEVKKAKGYWVMHPALGSYEEGKKKLREMKKAGFSDLWLFLKGEHKNAISLGLYSQRANAEAASKRAQKKGLPTKVLVRYVKFDQYWLEFQDREQLSISEESKQTLQEAYPNEKFGFKSCSNVVTE